MIDNGGAVIMCQRVSDAFPYRHLPGTSQDTCSRCLEKVWISPTTRMMKLERGWRVLCIQCATVLAEERGERPTLMMSREQEDELRRALTPEEFKKAMRFRRELEGG